MLTGNLVTLVTTLFFAIDENQALNFPTGIISFFLEAVKNRMEIIDSLEIQLLKNIDKPKPDFAHR